MASSLNLTKLSELTCNSKVQTVCVFLKLKNYSTFKFSFKENGNNNKKPERHFALDII